MKSTTISLLLLSLMTSAVTAQQPDVVTAIAKELADVPGKEVLMITVEYPPGWSDPVHRHDAQAFIYVLEGSIVMQVKGGKEVTLTPGQSFYEGPEDVHAGRPEREHHQAGKVPGRVRQGQRGPDSRAGQVTAAVACRPGTILILA